MTPLDHLLKTVASELNDANTLAVALFGSHSRDAATADSDLDVTHYVRVLPKHVSDRFWLRYRDGYLVAVLTTTIAEATASLTQPHTAIWAVPALRSARILLDHEGDFATIQRTARAFRWEPLQTAADEYASHRLMKFAEETHKLIAALRQGDDVKVATMTTWLVLGLPLVVATQRGILLDNETRAPRQVQQVLGENSAWSRAYRIAAGFGKSPALLSVEARGYAALNVYRETARVLRDILRPGHREVVEAVLAREACAPTMRGALSS